MRRWHPVLLVAVLALGACGGSDDPEPRERAQTAPAPAPEAPPPGSPRPAPEQDDPLALPGGVPREGSGPADASERAVVEGWLAAERRADFRRAGSYFAVPSIVQNGTPPLRLLTRRAVERWNASLPCGARLTELTGADGGWTIASFRLVKRRGADCGSGVGGSAMSAIRIRDGRIVAWHRLPQAGAPPAPQAPPAGPGDGQLQL